MDTFPGTAFELLDELELHPVSNLFILPLTDTGHADSDFKKIMRVPLSLCIIRDRLEDNQYEGLREVIADLNQLWSSIEKYFEQTDYLCSAAQVLKKITHKYESKVKLRSWIQDASVMRDILMELILNPPMLPNGKSAGISREAAIFDQLMGEYEIKEIRDKFDQIKGERENEEIQELIVNEQPESFITPSRSLSIYIPRIKPRTLGKLRKHMDSMV